MDSWDEIRTAFQVAKAGTVSGAAEQLGVHHATVIRHIDALEGRLGVKLFQRHARGYTATEAGADLLRVAQTTDDQFAQLAGRIKGLGEGVTGELVITALNEMTPRLVPVIGAYQQLHPEVCVRLLTGERLFKLEYGEAHVALRAGPKPDQPDNVVQEFLSLAVGMVASDAYIAQYGMPQTVEDLKDGHRFVGHDDETNRAGMVRWLDDTVGRDKIVFRATDSRIMREAILAGCGIGFLPASDLEQWPGLQQVLPDLPTFGAPVWLVTHVDLHRTAKVQSFVTFLKEQAADWTVI